MREQAYEQLTLFPEDFPASRFPLLGSAEAVRMTVTSGRKCSKSLKSCGPVGSLAKMLLESSIWRSTRCFLTWKVSATPHKRLLFRLVPSIPRTGGTGAQLWPTPTTGAGLCGGSGNYQQLKALEAAGKITEEERRNMAHGNGGQLNPDWVEWLMGFPIGWTSL